MLNIVSLSLYISAVQSELIFTNSKIYKGIQKFPFEILVIIKQIKFSVVLFQIFWMNNGIKFLHNWVEILLEEIEIFCFSSDLK